MTTNKQDEAEQSFADHFNGRSEPFCHDEKSFVVGYRAGEKVDLKIAGLELSVKNTITQNVYVRIK